jgi:ParB family chromosome partitioning protein
LSALIPGVEEDQAARLVDVGVDEVDPNPRQPRSAFDGEALAALAASISQVGLLQPIVVRRRPEGYELVAGERRLRAARLAGLATVPAVIREGPDGDALREALIENIHRADLAPLELAAAFQELLDELGATQEGVAAGLGVSRAHVANTIRLLSLPPAVQRLLAEGRIQAGHARALLGLSHDEARSALALRAAAEGMSVRQVEEAVRRALAPGPERASVPLATNPSAAAAAEVLTDRLATRVRVTMGKRRGRIVVDVGSAEDLARIVGLIAGGAAGG